MKTGGSFKALPFLARLIIVIFAVAGVVSIALALWYQSILSTTQLGFLPLLAALSARYKARVYGESTISFLTSVVMIGVVSDEPAMSMLAAICGVTIQALFPSKKLVPHRAIFNASMVVLTVAATWETHRLLAGANHSLDATSSEMVAAIVASFVYFVGNSLSVAIIISTTQRTSLLRVWVEHLMYSAPSFLTAGLVAVSLVNLVGSSAEFAPTALILSTSLAYYCATRRSGQQTTISLS